MNERSPISLHDGATPEDELASYAWTVAEVAASLTDKRSWNTSRKAGAKTADEGALRANLKSSVAALKRSNPGAPESRLRICRDILTGTNTPPELAGMSFDKMPPTERYYWLSALYMLLMPARRRQKLAAYFTPPHLCEFIINKMERSGLNLAKHSVLDPACGGAAFLVPLAARLAGQMRAAGRSSSDVLASVRARLSGIEVEPGLARLSEALVADIFASEIAIEGAGSLNIIQRASALKVNEPTRLYDAVICNPPYGRVFKASEDLLKRWAAVISAGHVNTYAIFTAMSLNRVVPGGLVALVLPTSFIAGPYFRALRSFILDKAHIESLDLVDKRSGAFIDVVQDTCVLFLRRKAAGLLPPPVPTSSLIASDGSAVGRGRLEVPASGSGVWVLPDISRVNLCTSEAAPFFHEGLSNLTEYGYTVKAGYFVWNRSKDRLHERVAPIEGEIPLIWAHNVRPGEEIKLGPRKGNAKDNASRSFVRVSPESSAVVRTAAIVIQRTTNRLQKRRIVAGKVPISLIETYGGFVTENHTLVVAPLLGKPQRVSLEVLLDLLCSIALDGKFRRVSGTVSVSAQVLRELPLPNPEVLVLETLKSGDFETAVVNAYAGSMGLRS